MQEVLDERENEVEQRIAAKRSAQKEVEAAATEIQNIRQLVLNSEVEFKRLQLEKKKFTLTAQTAGTVLTPELDLKLAVRSFL